MTRFQLLNRSRQSTEFSCGPAAVQAVLRHWGRDVAEEKLMELMGTNSDVGTHPENIVRGVRALGLAGRNERERHSRRAAGIHVVRKSSHHPWSGMAKQPGQGRVRRRRLGQRALHRRPGSGQGQRLLSGSVPAHGQGICASQAFRGALAPGDGRGPFEPEAHPRGDLHQGRKTDRGAGRSHRCFVDRLPQVRFDKPDRHRSFQATFFRSTFCSELRDLWESEFVRPAAFILLRKDAEGRLTAIEGGRLEDDERHRRDECAARRNCRAERERLSSCSLEG